MPRIGGAFPFTPANVAWGGGTVPLLSGQAFYAPAGNYLWGPGNQTCLQWFDPIAGQWRTIQAPDSGPTLFNTDGYNWRLINMSGVVVGANITNVGSGGLNGIGTVATGVTVAFASPGVTGAPTALGYPIVGGSVAAPTITQAGSGFVIPPIVLCDPPPFGGVQALFTCTLSAGGGIASIVTVNAGAGYLQSAPPNFYIMPQPATYQGAPSGGVAAAGFMALGLVHPLMVPPASAPGYNLSSSAGALFTSNANTGSGTLTGLVMYSYGGQYTGTTIPSITIGGCGAAAATAVMSMCMTSASGIVGGAGYGTSTPIFETSLGLIVSSLQNGALTPRAARGVLTVAGGAVSAVNIEDPGFGLQKVPVAAILNTSALATGQASFTPVCGGQTDTNILQAPVYA